LGVGQLTAPSKWLKKKNWLREEGNLSKKGPPFILGEEKLNLNLQPLF